MRAWHRINPSTTNNKNGCSCSANLRSLERGLQRERWGDV